MPLLFVFSSLTLSSCFLPLLSRFSCSLHHSFHLPLCHHHFACRPCLLPLCLRSGLFCLAYIWLSRLPDFQTWLSHWQMEGTWQVNFHTYQMHLKASSSIKILVCSQTAHTIYICCRIQVPSYVTQLYVLQNCMIALFPIKHVILSPGALAQLRFRWPTTIQWQQHIPSITACNWMPTWRIGEMDNQIQGLEKELVEWKTCGLTAEWDFVQVTSLHK